MNSRRRGYDLQEMWEANVAPWMMAARSGAGHMRHTAARERIRARGRVRARATRQRRRWLLMAGAGLVMLGIAGAATAMQAQQRRRADDQYPQGRFAPAGNETSRASGSEHRPPAHQQPQAQQEQARRQPQAPTSGTAASRRGNPQ